MVVLDHTAITTAANRAQWAELPDEGFIELLS
jgi:hypothetical protein